MVLLICIPLSCKQSAVAEWSNALIYLSRNGVARVQIPLETYIFFILNFSLPPLSEQVSGAYANEIKHDHSSKVIVVLDPRYDKSYKALYIYSRSIVPTPSTTPCRRKDIYLKYVNYPPYRGREPTAKHSGNVIKISTKIFK